mmetsp:Transcript_5331/g.12741  ORF Transcript_5331/g.12741 Transcript_5331/m.12741 type:complete len:236 (-) Transcript_5331:88-795(-)
MSATSPACQHTSTAFSSHNRFASSSTYSSICDPSAKLAHSSTAACVGVSTSGSNPPPSVPTRENSSALAIVAISWLKKHSRSVLGAVLVASRRGVVHFRNWSESGAPAGPLPHSHVQPPRPILASHSSFVSAWKNDFQDRPAPLLASCSGPAKMVYLTPRSLHLRTNSGCSARSFSSTMYDETRPVPPPSPGAAGSTQQKKSLLGQMGVCACSWWKISPPLFPSFVVQIRSVHLR